MQLLPDASRGRPLAIVLLLIVLLGGYLLLVHWWFTAPLLAARAELIELRDQEQKFRNTALQRDTVQQRMAEVRAFEADNPGFLPEADFDLAASSLIQRLQTAVDAQNAGDQCVVISRTPFRARSEEPFQRVTIKVRMRCDPEPFTAVLHLLEGGSPQLFVDELVLTSRRAVPTRLAQVLQGGSIDIAFDLYGYLRPTGGGA